MTFGFQGVFYLSGEVTHEIKNEQTRKLDLNYICALTTITLFGSGLLQEQGWFQKESAAEQGTFILPLSLILLRSENASESFWF